MLPSWGVVWSKEADVELPLGKMGKEKYAEEEKDKDGGECHEGRACIESQKLVERVRRFLDGTKVANQHCSRADQGGPFSSSWGRRCESAPR